MLLRMTLGDSLLDDIVVENEITSHSLTHSHRGFDSVAFPLSAPTQTLYTVDPMSATLTTLQCSYILII